MTDPFEDMKIDHIAMNVRDLEGARRFFEEFFGGTANDMYSNPRTGLRTYFITFDGGSRLELMNRPSLEGAAPGSAHCGYVHLSFSAGSKTAVDALTKRLADAGYEVIDGPRTTGDGYYESAVVGVEGNIIEITE